MSGRRGDPEVAVIVPLEDPRGDVVDNLGTWTSRQTLKRERFQLVASTDGRHPDFERRVSEVLEPQDEIVQAPGAPLMGLYDAAARAAKASVLVFTEAHVRAEPDCLAAVADLFAAEPELDAATFEHRQGTSGDVSKLSERWFARVHAIWRQQDWSRLNLGGVAIRAEAYARSGGLDPAMELFAPSFMSARFHQQGGRVRHLPEAKVTHLLEDTMSESLEHSTSFARGECVARTKHDPEFFDRYFGPAGLWGRRLSYRPDIAGPMVEALILAARRSPRDAGWLGRELAVRVPARVAGERPRWAWERGLAALRGAVASSSLFPHESRWRNYIAATEHSLRAVRLRQGAQQNGLPDPPVAGRSLGAENLDGVLVGGHGLETDPVGPFRWTEPVALLRLSPPIEGGIVRIDTGSLRGDPLGYLQGAYAGGSALAQEMISADHGTIEATLPPNFARRAAEAGIVLIFRPLVPARSGSSDDRRLGVPIRKLELRPL